MSETNTVEKLLSERQLVCPHDEGFKPVSQQAFADQGKQVMVLITTILCGKCGRLFFNTQETSIKVRLHNAPVVQMPESNKNN